MRCSLVLLAFPLLFAHMASSWTTPTRARRSSSRTSLSSPSSLSPPTSSFGATWIPDGFLSTVRVVAFADNPELVLSSCGAPPTTTSNNNNILLLFNHMQAATSGNRWTTACALFYNVSAPMTVWRINVNPSTTNPATTITEYVTLEASFTSSILLTWVTPTFRRRSRDDDGGRVAIGKGSSRRTPLHVDDGVRSRGRSRESFTIPLAFLEGQQWHKFNSGVICRGEPSMLDGEKKKKKKYYPHSSPLRQHGKTNPKGTSSSSSSATAASIENISNETLSSITTVHVVFTQHFDLGYTDYAWCAISHYFWYILPGTALAASADAAYVYTTHSWLLYFFFNCQTILLNPEHAAYVQPPYGITFSCPDQETLELVEQGINNGQIVWHTFPFDAFNEALGKVLFEYAFDFDRWLDQRFVARLPSPSPLGPNAIDKTIKVVQQVDVPGLYSVQLQEMKKQNVSAVYVGQNPFLGFSGAIGDIVATIGGKLFRWRPPTTTPTTSSSSFSKPVTTATRTDTTTANHHHQFVRTTSDGGNEMLMMVHVGGYGGIKASDAILDPVSGAALLVVCTLENQPPYTPQDVRTLLNRISREFPFAKAVGASTFQAFVRQVQQGGGSHHNTSTKQTTATTPIGVSTAPTSIIGSRSHGISSSSSSSHSTSTRRPGGPGITIIRDDLPLVTTDIGDAWVRAVSSDPVKTSLFLQRRREFESCVENNHCPHFDPQVMRHVLFLITALEHNYGLPMQATDWEAAVLSNVEKRKMIPPPLLLSDRHHHHQYPPYYSSVSEVMHNKNITTAAATAVRETSSTPRTTTTGSSRGGSSSRSSSNTNTTNTTVECLLDGNTTKIQFGFNATTGAINSLVIMTTTPNSSSFSSSSSSSSTATTTTVISDEHHPLFTFLYAIHETGTPWMVPTNNGWGSPMPESVVAANHPTLVQPVSLTQLSDSSCLIEVVMVLNQSYYDNNTKAMSGGQQPSLTATTSMEINVSFMVASKVGGGGGGGDDSGAMMSEDGTLRRHRTRGGSGNSATTTTASTSASAPVQYQLTATISLQGKATSDTNGLYASWAETIDLGDSLNLQLFPLMADPQLFPEAQWQLTALGVDYSPYHFHRLGTCQYHLVDSARIVSSLEASWTHHHHQDPTNHDHSHHPSKKTVRQHTNHLTMATATSPSTTSAAAAAAVTPITTNNFQVDTLDAPLLLFGWNNATWSNQGPPNPATNTCTPNTASGVWFNLWNSWNANWVIGWPWVQQEPLTFRFQLFF